MPCRVSCLPGSRVSLYSARLSIDRFPFHTVEPRIVPPVNRFKGCDTLAMLAEDDELYARLTRPDQLRTKAFVLLGYIAAYLQQVFLAVNDQARVIEVLIISDIKL